MLQSPKVATYDLQPEMSAAGVIETVLAELGHYDLIILNFANPDMVGHTGVVEAAVKAVETIDDGVRRIIGKVLELGGKALVTADHGNCEFMRNADGSPNTAPHDQPGPPHLRRRRRRRLLRGGRHPRRRGSDPPPPPAHPAPPPR